MAAISAILTLLKSGDHIISNYNVYGGTFRLIDKILLDMGIKVSWVDTSSIDEVKNIKFINVSKKITTLIIYY